MGAGGFATQNAASQIDHGLFAGEPENAEDIALADLFAAKRHKLIEHRLGIAQSALRETRNQGADVERDISPAAHPPTDRPVRPHGLPECAGQGE